VEGNLLATAALGPELLLLTSSVAPHDALRGIEDGLRGAIVLLQQNDMHRREIALEVAHHLRYRPSPAIYGLVIIANRADIAVPRRLRRARRQQPHQLVLRFIRI